MTRYAHASNKLLGIQIDAAINPGKLPLLIALSWKVTMLQHV